MIIQLFSKIWLNIAIFFCVSVKRTHSKLYQTDLLGQLKLCTNNFINFLLR